MKATHYFLALILVTGSSCASTGSVPPSTTLHGVTIVERSITPPYTGYIRTWIQFKVRAAGTDIVVLLPHFEDGRQIPEVGEMCEVSYHIESVDGQVGDKNVRQVSANVIDRLECKRI